MMQSVLGDLDLQNQTRTRAKMRRKAARIKQMVPVCGQSRLLGEKETELLFW